jgi:hypothetical protein
MDRTLRPTRTNRPRVTSQSWRPSVRSSGHSAHAGRRRDKRSSYLPIRAKTIRFSASAHSGWARSAQVQDPNPRARASRRTIADDVSMIANMQEPVTRRPCWLKRTCSRAASALRHHGGGPAVAVMAHAFAAEADFFPSGPTT